MNILSRRWWAITIGALAAGGVAVPARADSTGQTSGLLPRDHLTLENAIQVAVQTVRLESPTPQQNRFGQAVVDFAGAPEFSPTRIAEPGPGGFPLAKFQPGAVAGSGYNPLWDAQLGLWTPKAVQQGLNSRQIDEVHVFNLAATRPDLLTGVDPATGQPAPYGAVGVDINCAVIGFTSKTPTANLATRAPNSQFPPR